MNEAQRQATDWLSGQYEAMEKLLQSLVDTDSNSYDKAGVDAVGELLAAQLLADGISVERIPVEGFGDVLLAELPGGPGKPVLLLGHRDTVFPKGTTSTRGYTKNAELAYGPGVADMKGGLVLNCFALKALKRIGPLPFPVQILYTGDEEIGSASARVHIEKYARQARAVLNPEPGRASGNVVSARKGGATLIIEVSGRAAHSGVNHADGASAIQALAHKVIKLHALTDYAAGITTNVGLISGGTSSNTVAPSATAKLDVRFVELRQWDEILAAVQAIVAEEELPGTSARLLEATTFLPMEARHSTELLSIYQGLAQELGFSVEGEFTGGCADSGFTASLGIPTLCGLGPVGGKVHTDREYLELDTLVPRGQALVATILALGDA
ncbi:peptidase M20 [Pseudomonas amygdali pv. tabaci str. ATCC 11528]|uniref:M20 family metallopeptidase n=1 Tax=Pseudomonas syringae group TaxID=136849 RepID=UPI000209A415|nr:MULTISPECIES: M20 family metallopeptidase [Pseudomonas syringae group]KKY53980.1 peptidase M20 [Pseudomonas amygdali pv. tabaci str. ATCC 11528]MDU8648594.1 M20 family metallopeptidase [Pseudomonas syringae group sp. 26L6]QED84367.1 M20 family metallopeptidase [Pseudomonas amygdali pv. tabaci str. ATCC 11528]